MPHSTAAPAGQSDVVDVLIVGAGPTGMIVAHELLRRGVSCRIVEKRPTPSGATRAFTLHARTMEMFDHMGLAHRIDELREVCPGNRFHFKGLDPALASETTLDFRRLSGTRYNFYGKVNQSDLDRALREHLSANHAVRPEYGVAYEGHEDTASGVKVRVAGADGTATTIRARWLVGADGSNSTVRTQLGAEFKQHDDKTMTMSMVDVFMSGYSGDRNWVNYYVSADGFMLVTGLPGGKFRLYLAGKLENYLKEAEPQTAFQRGLDYFETGARIDEMEWSSTWVIRKIVGDAYQSGHVVLCGDATHVHSPAGGQGMNACMQDGFNLGWKLALIVQGQAADGVIESYRTERQPIAQQVTGGADAMHQILFNAELPIEERFKLTQDPAWHNEAITRISALSHHYRGVDGLAAGAPLADEDIHPGDRAPDCVLSDAAPKLRLHDLCRHTGFTLLLVPGPHSECLEEARLIAQQVDGAYEGLVKPVILAPAAIPGCNPDHVARDRLGDASRLYGQPGGGQGMTLIRPDMYVAFRGRLTDIDDLHRYLTKWIALPVRQMAEVAD